MLSGIHLLLPQIYVTSKKIPIKSSRSIEAHAGKSCENVMLRWDLFSAD
jgi:hypothetical protein